MFLLEGLSKQANKKGKERREVMERAAAKDIV